MLQVLYKNSGATSGPIRREALSNLLPSDFEESIIDFQGGVPRTNAEEYIQPFLNGGNCELIWNKKVAISSPLRSESNTKIKAFSDTGAIVANGSEKPIFMNKNIVFAHNENIIDQNIIIDGGIWHGNNSGQNTKGTPTHGLATIMSFHGCKNLVVQNCRFYEPMTYCIMSNNMVDSVYQDIFIDVGVNTRSNKDGVHFDGWSRNCRISRLNVKTLDDAIGLNTNDAHTKRFNYPDRTFTDFYDVSMYGDIDNIIVEDLFLNNSIFGIRLLSSVNKVSNITIRRFRGTTGQYCILIDNFQTSVDWCTPFGYGNFENIFIDDIDVMISDRVQWTEMQNGVMNIAANITNLQATNVQPARNPNQSIPLVRKRTTCIDGTLYIYNNCNVNGSPL